MYIYSEKQTDDDDDFDDDCKSFVTDYQLIDSTELRFTRHSSHALSQTVQPSSCLDL